MLFGGKGKPIERKIYAEIQSRIGGISRKAESTATGVPTREKILRNYHPVLFSTTLSDCCVLKVLDNLLPNENCNTFSSRIFVLQVARFTNTCITCHLHILEVNDGRLMFV